MTTARAMATGSVPVEAGRRSRLRAVWLSAIAVAGTAVAAATIWAVARSPILESPTSSAVLRGLEIELLVGVGLYFWWRRPDSRLGLLLVGVGFVYALTTLNASERSLPFTIGTTSWALFVLGLSYVYLAFPRGQLESRAERALVFAFGLATALVWALILVLSETLPTAGPLAACRSHCPHNAFQFIDAPTSVGRGLDAAYGVATAVGLIGIAVLIVRKARSPDRLRRRALGPVAVTFVALIAGYLLYRWVTTRYEGTGSVFRVALGLVALAAPVSMLAGHIWGSMGVATRVGRIAIRAGAAPLDSTRLQSLIGDALGDPTLQVALWVSRRGDYVDVDGSPLQLPGDTRVRGVTLVTRDERPVAALLHAPDLYVDPEVVDTLAATSLLLLENTRLVDELRASRSRIVGSAEEERQRLERDLHDGAQQRLMAIKVKLSLARKQATDGDLARRLDDIAVDATAAVEELRTLAHGIYPTVLRERGIGDGLRSAAIGATIPVRVVDESLGRCSGTTEAAIYFCCLEAIQNAVKHAGPGVHVVVTIRRSDERVEFEVADDGVGMDPGRASDGIGLISMHDRIGAVGGELEIVSAPGSGVTVRGSVPVTDDRPPVAALFGGLP